MNVLLVNPLVHDFAAYDFWARPLGLLWLGAALRCGGARVTLLDCMDPTSPLVPERLRPRRAQGRGRFIRSQISRPAALPDIGRRYCQYGLPADLLRQALDAAPRPDAVLVTSGMTYWYPGVVATVEQIRDRWPDSMVLLGGIYASLCPEHATRNSGADRVLPGPMNQHLETLWGLLQLEGAPPDPAQILPAQDLAPHADAAALLTSTGCPLRCAYCGVERLQPRFVRFPVERVLGEVEAIAASGVRDIALLDDSFLADPDRAAEILERVADRKLGLRLHGASGLACRGVKPRVARAMQRAGFATVRLGLETSDSRAQREQGGKVTTAEFHAALDNLEAAGFSRAGVGVYVMVAMPGQGRAVVERSIDVVLSAGARPHLTEYSPVPGSPLFEQARATSRFDLDEPLFHNPTLLPCADAELTAPALQELKLRLRQSA